MAPTPNAAILASEQPTRWDWWPLLRLLTVLSVFGGIAYHLGWQIGATEALGLPRRIFEVLSFFTLVSFGLAHLYLVLLMFPLYAVVTLNDVFYDAGRGVFRTLGVRSQLALAGLGLGCEVVLFGACLAAIRALLMRL